MKTGDTLPSPADIKGGGQSQEYLQKLVAIEGFGIHVCSIDCYDDSTGRDDGCILRTNPDREGWKSAWVVGPWSLRADIRTCKNTNQQYDVTNEITLTASNPLKVSVTHTQVVALRALQWDLESVRTRTKLWHLRPEKRVMLGGVFKNARAWWLYARDAILMEVKARRAKLGIGGGSWNQLVTRVKLRTQYIEHYTRLMSHGMKKPPKKTEAAAGGRAEGAREKQEESKADDLPELAILKKLELELTAEEILLYRGVARTKARLAGVEAAKVSGMMKAITGWWASDTTSPSTNANGTPKGGTVTPTHGLSPTRPSKQGGVSPNLPNNGNGEDWGGGNEHSKGPLSSESAFDEVAEELLSEWAALKGGSGMESEKRGSGSIVHINFRLGDIGLELHATEVVKLSLVKVSGEVWRAGARKELGCNLSVGSIRASGGKRTNILEFKSSTVLHGQALVFHYDQCPLPQTSDLIEEHQVSEFALTTYLGKTRKVPCQATVEAVIAPIEVNLDFDLIGDMQKFFAVGGELPPFPQPLVDPAPFQELRNLAASRRAYSVQSHVDYILRNHVTSNVAVTLEGLDLSIAEKQGSDAVVVNVKSLRMFRGAYLEAIVMQSSGEKDEFRGRAPDVASVFSLSHDLTPPGPEILQLSNQRSSLFVQRTLLSVASMNLSAIIYSVEAPLHSFNNTTNRDGPSNRSNPTSSKVSIYLIWDSMMC